MYKRDYVTFFIISLKCLFYFLDSVSIFSR